MGSMGEAFFKRGDQADGSRAGGAQQHGAGLARDDLAHHVIEVLAVNGQRRLRRRLGALRLQRAVDVGQHFLAVVVVQVDDGQVLDAHAHDALHQALGFVGEAGAHMEHVAHAGLAQRRRARARPDVRQVGLFNQRHDGGVVGRAHAGHQRKNAAVADHLLDVVGAALRHIGVVQHLELQHAAVHAALGIDLAHGRVHAQLELGAHAGQRAAGRARAADGDGLGGQAVLGIGIADESGGGGKGSHLRGERKEAAAKHREISTRGRP
jgi:hypothetical protein